MSRLPTMLATDDERQLDLLTNTEKQLGRVAEPVPHDGRLASRAAGYLRLS